MLGMGSAELHLPTGPAIRRMLDASTGWPHLLRRRFTVSGAACTAQSSAFRPALPYDGFLSHPLWPHLLFRTSTIPFSACSAQSSVPCHTTDACCTRCGHLLFRTSTIPFSACSAQTSAVPPALPYDGCLLHPLWPHLVRQRLPIPFVACAADVCHTMDACLLHPLWPHLFFRRTLNISGAACSAQSSTFPLALPYDGCLLQPLWPHPLWQRSTIPFVACAELGLFRRPCHTMGCLFAAVVATLLADIHHAALGVLSTELRFPTGLPEGCLLVANRVAAPPGSSLVVFRATTSKAVYTSDFKATEPPFFSARRSPSVGCGCAGQRVFCRMFFDLNVPVLRSSVERDRSALLAQLFQRED